LSELFSYFKEIAYDYADRFDQRNNNSNYRKEVDAALV